MSPAKDICYKSALVAATVIQNRIDGENRDGGERRKKSSQGAKGPSATTPPGSSARGMCQTAVSARTRQHTPISTTDATGRPQKGGAAAGGKDTKMLVSKVNETTGYCSKDSLGRG